MTLTADLTKLLVLCHESLERAGEVLLAVIEDDEDTWVREDLARAAGKVIAYAEDPADAYTVLEVLAMYHNELVEVMAAMLEACPNCFSDLECCTCED